MEAWLPAGIRLLEWGADSLALWARVQVEPDSPCFRGHFEGRPILPGIAQLGLVLSVLEAHGQKRGLRGVRSLKLRRLVQPGEVLHVRVERPDASGISRFETRAGKDGVADGAVVTWEPAP